MGRIRTIKPEFPQSETVGSLSRDARLLFIQLWTAADDSGRLRGASRLLASLLYPYDEDAPALIESWLNELVEKGCVRRYQVGGNQYVEIANWLDHQKIDRPTPSRLPSFDEGSEIPRESSRALDDGPRTVDLGPVPRTVDCSTSPAATAPNVHDEVQQALEAYNATAERVGWPKAQVLNDKRKRRLAARLAECGGLAGWNVALEKGAASDFLCGRSGRGNGHSNWTPNIDFFLQQSSFLKLMEGSYDNRNSAPSRTEWQRTLDRLGELGSGGDSEGASVSDDRTRSSSFSN